MFNAIKAQLAPYVAFVKTGVALALLAGVASASWYVRGTIADSQISELKLTYAKEQTLAAEKSREELAAVIERSNSLQKTIEGVSNAQYTKEKSHLRTIADLDAQLARLRNAKPIIQQRECSTATAGEATPAGQHAEASTTAGVVSPADWRDALLQEAATALRELAPALQVSHERHEALTQAYMAAQHAADD